MNKVESGYYCKNHGLVEPGYVSSIDEYGYTFSYTICPYCRAMVFFQGKMVGNVIHIEVGNDA